MQGTLVLTILSVQSSYLREIEVPLSDEHVVPDTIQWWISDTGSWRIRTYGMDHDIHIHALGHVADLKVIAVENDRRNYGDVMGSQHVVELVDAIDPVSVGSAFAVFKLAPRVEIETGQFVFWKPDEARYFTQSEPK